MRTAMQELRPDGVEKALRLASACGCTTLPGRLIPAFSLVVSEGDEPVAVALCIEHVRRHRLEIGLAAGATQLHRDLVDKALMKLRAGGVRKCDIRTNGGDDPTFFGAVSWRGEPTPEAA